MRSGALRQRITIQQKSVTRNSFGEEIVTWPTFATRWAEVTPVSGREFIEQSRGEAAVSHRVRIRYTAGVKPQMRVLFEGRILSIEAVLNQQEANREQVLMCTELVQ